MKEREREKCVFKLLERIERLAREKRVWRRLQSFSEGSCAELGKDEETRRVGLGEGNWHQDDDAVEGRTTSFTKRSMESAFR